jgi:hypothetical protein
MTRRPFQGIWNIVRFNWPFYLLSVVGVVALFAARNYFNDHFLIAIDILVFLIVGSTLVTLLVSFYVYDISEFYELGWLDDMPQHECEKIANINAGFDETSALLKERFRNAELSVCDFYDPKVHTEASIKRARKAYPPFPGTRTISTQAFPFENGTIARIFAIMSAHEIRNAEERCGFFTEVDRVLSTDGRAVVVEHLRDAANLLAYNVGAFHFYSRATWIETFEAANLMVVEEKKITQFLTAFFLSKNGAES